jgi:hypothetical protein
MARVFLTKVWGFSPRTYPALGFASEAGRIKFLRESQPGDWVVLAGTLSAPTSPEHRGRLLGKVQLGTDEIDVEEVLRSVGTEIPIEHYRDDGEYRWPYGLPIISAEHFLDLPDVAQVFGNYLSGTQWAAYALDIDEYLGPEMKTKVDALKTQPAKIIDAPIIIQQRERQNALILNRNGPTGPGPSISRNATERTPGSASAYLFQLHGGTREVFKVGYATDVQDRLLSLNKGLITTITGYLWKIILKQEFRTERQAYDFEQRLHVYLREHKVQGEQEVYSISRRTIESIWTDVFTKGEWAIPGDNASV